MLFIYIYIVLQRSGSRLCSKPVYWIIIPILTVFFSLVFLAPFVKNGVCSLTHCAWGLIKRANVCSMILFIRLMRNILSRCRFLFLHASLCTEHRMLGVSQRLPSASMAPKSKCTSVAITVFESLCNNGFEILASFLFMNRLELRII